MLKTGWWVTLRITSIMGRWILWLWWLTIRSMRLSSRVGGLRRRWCMSASLEVSKKFLQI